MTYSVEFYCFFGSLKSFCYCSTIWDKVWFETDTWEIWSWCKDGKLKKYALHAFTNMFLERAPFMVNTLKIVETS